MKFKVGQRVKVFATPGSYRQRIGWDNVIGTVIAEDPSGGSIQVKSEEMQTPGYFTHFELRHCATHICAGCDRELWDDGVDYLCPECRNG